MCLIKIGPVKNKDLGGENSGKNIDLVKISPDLREIVLEFRKISSEFGFFRRILENFG